MTSALFLIAFSGSLCAAPLAYKMTAGTQFQLDTVTDTELPVVGPKHLTVKADVRVESLAAEGMKLQQTVTSSTPGKPDFVLNLGCMLSPEGRISEITGVDLNNPKFALAAKNATMALPPLPNDEVAMGMTWEDEKALALPKAPIPGVPDNVRITTQYKVTGIAKANGRDAVTIAMVVNQSSGQKVQVHAEGNFVVEAGTGRPISSHLQGEAKLRVVFKTFKVPFKIDMTAK